MILYLKNIKIIESIASRIIQGRYDVVCPMQSAWDLHKKLKHLEFYIIDKAGHSMLEKDIQNQLIDCTNRFAKY